jgi:hypothetical protein
MHPPKPRHSHYYSKSSLLFTVSSKKHTSVFLTISSYNLVQGEFIIFVMSISDAKLKDPYIKQLCIDIEASNLLRENLTFGAICRTRKNYYDVSEGFKKKYNKEFDQLKRRKQESYIVVLDKFDIELGPALQRELRREEKTVDSSAPQPEPESDSDSESDDLECFNYTSPPKSAKPELKSVIFKSPSKSESPPKSAKPESKSVEFKSPSKSESPPKSAKSESKSEYKSPSKSDSKSTKFESTAPDTTVADLFNRLEISSPTPRPRSLVGVKKQIMFSPLSVASAAKSANGLVHSDESIASTSIAEVLKFVEVLETIHQDGTLEYPFIHIVNMEYPERNRGFDIVLVNDIEHQGFTRDGFHIRKAVAVMDSTRWEAFVPYTKFPTLAHRALMFVGPSQDYWHRNTALYHEDNVDCKPTQKKHSTTQKAIKNNPLRQLEHTLMVFGEGVHFENHIFSNDAKKVAVVPNEMCTSIDNGGEELELDGISLFWRIAIAGGDELDTDETKVKFFSKKKRSAKS